MRHEDLFYVLALLKVEGVGDIVAKKLLTHCPEPALIFKAVLRLLIKFLEEQFISCHDLL